MSIIDDNRKRLDNKWNGDKKLTGKNDSKASTRKIYSAPALEKGLDILELLCQEPGGLNINEIVFKLNRSIGELFRMLVVLEQRGYVSSVEGTDKYIMTLRLFGMAHQFPPIKRLTTAARPLMRRLSYSIEQSCHLVIYYEGNGHVVEQQDSPSARVFSVRLGAIAPLLDTCSGHVLLAFSNEEQREQMIMRMPKQNKRIRDDIKKIVTKVLEQKHEVIKSRQVEGIHDIGFPVFDHTENIVAVLVVPFFAYLDDSHPVKLEDAKQYLADAALDLSKSLGYKAM